mmetsp:Transcript_51423/g.111641  ORF Transcript_51423/g.111641 Transcript_51423/m.111641 type:complete len:208 (+) Transcript_51423:289-912(+)
MVILRGGDPTRAVRAQDFVHAVSFCTKAGNKFLMACACFCGMLLDKIFDKAQQPWKCSVVPERRAHGWLPWCGIICHLLRLRLPAKKGKPCSDKNLHCTLRGVFTSSQRPFNQSLVSLVCVMLQGFFHQLLKGLQVSLPWFYQLDLLHTDLQLLRDRRHPMWAFDAVELEGLSHLGGEVLLQGVVEEVKSSKQRRRTTTCSHPPIHR